MYLQIMGNLIIVRLIWRENMWGDGEEILIEGE